MDVKVLLCVNVLMSVQISTHVGVHVMVRFALHALQPQESNETEGDKCPCSEITPKDSTNSSFFTRCPLQHRIPHNRAYMAYPAKKGNQAVFVRDHFFALAMTIRKIVVRAKM
jgi:hypothetical protein